MRTPYAMTDNSLERKKRKRKKEKPIWCIEERYDSLESRDVWKLITLLRVIYKLGTLWRVIK